MTAERSDTVETIKSRVDLPKLAGELGLAKLRQVGQSWVACCPFHDDHGPSLRFYGQPNPTFHCFACAAHGDAFTLVQKMKGVDFATALEWLSRYANVPLGARRFSVSRASGLDLAWKAYRQAGGAGLDVLAAWVQERNLSRDTVDLADLVGIPGPILTRGARDGRYLAGWERWEWEALEEAGVVRTNTKEAEGAGSTGRLPLVIPQDVFWYKGVLFPLRDMSGGLTGFAVRKTEDSDYQGPKYRYTAGFERSRCLYGLNRVLARIGKESKVQRKAAVDLFVVEGLVDALRLEQLGLHAVALLGNSIAGRLVDEGSQLQQIAALKERLQDRALHVHLFLDRDEPGQAGMMRVVQKFLELQLSTPLLHVDCLVGLLSDTGKDPDELLRSASANTVIAFLEARRVSAAAFVASRILETRTEALSDVWNSLSPLQQSQLGFRVCRFLTGGEPIPETFYTSVLFGQERNAASEPWATSLAVLSSRNALPDSLHLTRQPLSESVAAAFTRALQLARESYADTDFCVDTGSWRRLELAGDLIWETLGDRLRNRRPPIEPFMPTLTPRLDGGDPRLRVLPCPEDLVLESLVLGHLLAFASENTRTIPLVIHDRTTNEAVTVGPTDLIPDGDTVSFAYQFNRNAFGLGNVRESGLFRHFSECWLAFTDFVLARVMRCPKEQPYLYVARLDIHRYYDSLPLTTVGNVLSSALKAAISAAGAEPVVPMLDEPLDSVDDRVSRLREWILGSRTFGYEWYSPNGDGHTRKWPSQTCGVPQGPNLSAWLANIALFPLDRALAAEVAAINKDQGGGDKDGLLATYARYVDDIILVAPSRDSLEQLRLSVARKLDAMGLLLSPKTEPLPPMKPEEVRGWLLQNRGVADGASGNWALPVVATEATLARTSLSGGTLDRRDALALLHSDDATDFAVSRDRLLETIEVVARHAEEVRYGDYRAMARNLFYIVGVDKRDHQAMSSKAVAKEFWRLWSERVSPLTTEKPHGRDSSKGTDGPLTSYRMAVEALWPLCVSLEGLQRALMQRQDRNPFRPRAQRKDFVEVREVLAGLVSNGLLADLRSELAARTGVSDERSEILSGILLYRVLAIRRVVATIGHKLSFNKRADAPWLSAYRPSSISRVPFYRLALSCGTDHELHASAPYSEETLDQDSKQIILFHECIERLVHGATSGPDPLTAVSEGIAKLCQPMRKESSLAVALRFLRPDTDAADDKAAGHDMTVLRTLSVFARCVDVECQIRLLSHRKTLVGVFALAGRFAILPTPEGLSPRVLLLCELEEHTRKVSCCRWLTVTGASADVAEMRVEDVVIPGRGFKEQRQDESPTPPYLMFSAPATGMPLWSLPQVTTGTDQMPNEAPDLKQIVTAFRALVAVPNVGSLVIAHSHILVDVTPGDPKYSVFSWAERQKNTLSGKAFVSRCGSWGTVIGDVPPSNDWVWRIGHAVVGLCGLCWMVDKSEECRIGKPANEDMSNWASWSLLHHAVLTLTGRYWWSRPAPKEPTGFQDVEQGVLPRVVQDCLVRLEALSDPTIVGNPDVAMSIVLGARADARAMATLFEYPDKADHPGFAAFLLAKLVPGVLRADEGLVDALCKNAPGDALKEINIRRDVQGTVALCNAISALCQRIPPEHLTAGLRGLLAGTAIASVVRNVRDFVLEVVFSASPLLAVVARDHKNEVREWLLSGSALLTTQHATEADGWVAVEKAAQWFDDLRTSVTPIQAMREMESVTPLGWSVFAGLVELWLGSRDALAANRRGCMRDSVCHRLIEILSLHEKREDDAYPWDMLMRTCNRWTVNGELQRWLVDLTAKQAELGITVSKVRRGTHPIRESHSAGVDFRTASGTEFRLTPHQIGHSTLRGERAGSYEREAMQNGPFVHVWTETYWNGRLIGGAMTSPMLAKLMGSPASPAQIVVETSPPAASLPGEDSVALHAVPISAKADKVTEAADSSAGTTGPENRDIHAIPQEGDLSRLYEMQERLWHDRSPKRGNHLRIALFQHGVEESYSHPLREICIRSGHAGMTTHQCSALKSNPSRWTENQDLPSCSEYRRRQLLDQAIRASKAFDVDMLLLPEYSVRPETISWLAERLKGVNLTVWAGTFRIPFAGVDPKWVSGIRAGRGACLPGASCIAIVSGEGILSVRGKRYPSVSAGERFRPFYDGGSALKPLFESVPNSGSRCKPGDFVAELICSEVFMATSPANMFALSQAFAKLHALYTNRAPIQAEVDFIRRVVLLDLEEFAKHTSMAPPLNFRGETSDFLQFFPRRTVLFVPSMSGRTVDFHVLGQANYLAAGMCVVYCNAVSEYGRGASCFIGNGATEPNDSSDAYGDTRFGPYNGVHPGVFRDGAMRKGALGEHEQALVIVDVDPLYMNEGRPRHQLLPPPLELVAHLPVIEYTEDSFKSWLGRLAEKHELPGSSMSKCACFDRGSGVCVTHRDLFGVNGLVLETLRCLDRFTSFVAGAEGVSVPGELYGSTTAFLRTLEKVGRESPWLSQRRQAFERSHGLIRSLFPPPAVYDYLPVFVNHESASEGASTTMRCPPIAVPGINFAFDDDVKSLQADNEPGQVGNERTSK